MTDREGERRLLLDRVEDERGRVRAHRLRRAARLAGLLLVAAATVAVIAALVDLRAIADHPLWSGVGFAVVLLAGHGLGAEVHGWLRVRDEDARQLRRVIRAHRDHELGEWPGARDDGGRQWLLDDLDDARAERRRALRLPVFAAAASAVLAGALAVELVRPAGLWATGWGFRLLVLGTVCLTVPAAEVLVSGLAGGRLGATKANLVAARRRHRDAALYDEPPPNPRPSAELPALTQRGWTSAVLPTVAVAFLAALVVSGAVPVGDAPAPAAPDPVALPGNLAARKSAAPVDWPSGVAVAPDGRTAYVGNSGPADKPDATVAVVDLGADKVTTTLPVAPRPMALALTPDGSRLVVASTGPAGAPAGALTILDPVARKVVATVPLASAPLDVAVSADGRTAWSAVSGTSRYGTGTAVAVDLGTGTVVASVPVGVNPAAIALDGGRAYVANFGENTVSVVDTGARTVVSTVDVGAGPGGLVVDARRHTVWVANESDSDPHRTLTAIDTTTLKPTPVDLGPPPAGAGSGAVLALTPDGRRLLVGRSSPTMDPLPLLDVVDPATRRPVGVLTLPYAYRIAASPDGHHAITASGDLWVVDIP